MKKLLFVCILLVSMPVFAAITQIITVEEKSIPVYNEANTNTKPAMTFTKGQKLISIYQQNNWIKVANPDNGNVGWVKKNDWKAATKNIVTIEQVGNGYSISSQRSDGSMNSSYRMIQTSGDSSTNSKEMNDFLSDLQKQQKNMEQRFDQIRQDMMKNMELLDEHMKQLWKENTPAVIENPKDNQSTQKQNQKDTSKK